VSKVYAKRPTHASIFIDAFIELWVESPKPKGLFGEFETVQDTGFSAIEQRRLPPRTLCPLWFRVRI
jgi:hypothetical protein